MNDSRDPKDLLDWLGLKNAPTWRVARPLGYLFGAVVVGLFLLAVAATAWTVFNVFSTPAGATLGTGALLVALLGAPFLVWRTVIAHRTLNFQKEGHITDRVAKAVEQLGAEKKVDRIGRPVTLWTGQPTEEEIFFGKADKVVLPERCLEISRRWETRMASPSPLSSSVEEGVLVRVQRWPTTETRIEWQGKPPAGATGDYIAHIGDWQTFSESLPNIEVRIGGILSLERIAKDSTAYDNGRDHVPIMEILCAYIRENAPASGAQDHPFDEWEPLTDDATEEERKAEQQRWRERFDNHLTLLNINEWARSLAAPRQDIALALEVIGRRNAAQRRIEARWRKDAESDAEWPFDTPVPTLSDQEALKGSGAIDDFGEKLEAWKERITAYSGYRPDLRGTNLQAADLSGLIFSGALMSDTRLQGARLGGARMEGANLSDARMEGAGLRAARLEGALLNGARMERAILRNGRFEGAEFLGARMEAADLCRARMAGAALWGARMEGAVLYGAKMDATTWLSGASLRFARLKDVDYSSVPISQEQLNETFGDASVTLPDGLTRPAHWPRHKLSPRDFETEWRKWQANPANYTPPD